jgi:hypothetical protein
MKGKVTLVVKGFETVEQAQAFASWYSGQGEQDSSEWFENQDDLEGVTGMYSEGDKTEGNTVTMTLRMIEGD